MSCQSRLSELLNEATVELAVIKSLPSCQQRDPGDTESHVTTTCQALTDLLRRVIDVTSSLPEEHAARILRAVADLEPLPSPVDVIPPTDWEPGSVVTALLAAGKLPPSGMWIVETRPDGLQVFMMKTHGTMWRWWVPKFGEMGTGVSPLPAPAGSTYAVATPEELAAAGIPEEQR